jgi:hypothetical protein
MGNELFEEVITVLPDVLVEMVHILNVGCDRALLGDVQEPCSGSRCVGPGRPGSGQRPLERLLEGQVPGVA